MGTVNKWLQNQATVVHFPCPVYEQVIVDFSTLNCSAGDVIQLFNVLPGFVAKRVLHHVDTAEGGTLTGNVGDESNPDRYDAAINLNSAGNGQMVGTLEATDEVGPGWKYTSADTIDLVLGHDADTAVVTFTLEGSNSRV